MLTGSIPQTLSISLHLDLSSDLADSAISLHLHPLERYEAQNAFIEQGLFLRSGPA